MTHRAFDEEELFAQPSRGGLSGKQAAVARTERASFGLRRGVALAIAAVALALLLEANPALTGRRFSDRSAGRTVLHSPIATTEKLRGAASHGTGGSAEGVPKARRRAPVGASLTWPVHDGAGVTTRTANGSAAPSTRLDNGSTGEPGNDAAEFSFER